MLRSTTTVFQLLFASLYRQVFYCLFLLDNTPALCCPGTILFSASPSAGSSDWASENRGGVTGAILSIFHKRRKVQKNSS
mmetsp:Transcript_547/g.839  ORF Transcript_547/g.839 Transcript_547/m.839 type:complete len:80 (-) Transcript_547:2185-2424(-)